MFGESFDYDLLVIGSEPGGQRASILTPGVGWRSTSVIARRFPASTPSAT
jgi:alkyl hydroperoxide reductase subunit AhpF